MLYSSSSSSCNTSLHFEKLDPNSQYSSGNEHTGSACRVSLQRISTTEHCGHLGSTGRAPGGWAVRRGSLQTWMPCWMFGERRSGMVEVRLIKLPQLGTQAHAPNGTKAASALWRPSKRVRDKRRRTSFRLGSDQLSDRATTRGLSACRWSDGICLFLNGQQEMFTRPRLECSFN